MIPIYYFLMLFYRKYTKGYNKNVYKIAILELLYHDNEEYYGLCFLMRYIANCNNIEKFKELYTQKPNLSDHNWSPAYWYSRDEKGSQQRIAALKEAIKLCKQ